MFTKTTSFAFSEYGEIVNKSEYKFPQKNIHSTLRIKREEFYFFSFLWSWCIYSGYFRNRYVSRMQRRDIKAPEQFIIHRTIKIKKRYYYLTFISISHSARILMNTDTKAKKTTHPLPKDAPIVYEPIIPSFEIKEILSYFYQVRNASYEFPGEEHEFWELTLIDNGELTTTVNDEEYNLDEMDLILYAPGQYHTQKPGIRSPAVI